MVYSLQMPKALRDKGWKVKIRNLERTEDPHVTILRKTNSWRYNIRKTGFMDSEPDPRHVPDEVVKYIAKKLATLRTNDHRDVGCRGRLDIRARDGVGCP